jgi:hypothetical protein
MMEGKKILMGALLLLLVGGLGYALTFIPLPRQETPVEILPGQKTAEGDYLYVEETPQYHISVSYPSQTPLATEADMRARTAIEKTLKVHIDEFKSLASELPTVEERQQVGLVGPRYELTIAYKPYRSSAHVSYEFDVYVDTGGAHPNGYFDTLVFDLEGQEIDLADLFKEGSDYLQRLSAAAGAQVAAKLEEMAGQGATASVYAEGLAPAPENFESFLLDGEELLILIPPYQAAAYAAGSFEVRVPLSSLQDILK